MAHVQIANKMYKLVAMKKSSKQIDGAGVHLESFPTHPYTVIMISKKLPQVVHNMSKMTNI